MPVNTLTKESFLLTALTDILEPVVPKRTRFAKLLEWIKEEQGLTLRKLEERSGGKLRHNTLSVLQNEPEPNPKLDTIHALAKTAKIPEQMVIDALLGKAFLADEKLSDEVVKEVFHQYQTIRPENRSELLLFTFNTLRKLIADAVEQQEATHKTSR